MHCLQFYMLLYVCMYIYIYIIPTCQYDTSSYLVQCTEAVFPWLVYLTNVTINCLLKEPSELLSYCLHIRFYLANIHTCHYKSQSDKQTNKQMLVILLTYVTFTSSLWLYWYFSLHYIILYSIFFNVDVLWVLVIYIHTYIYK